MERKTIIRQLINGDSIFDDYDKSLSWVRVEDGLLLEAAIVSGSGGSISPAFLEQITKNKEQIERNSEHLNSIEDELQDHKTEFTNFYETEFKTLQQDEHELGEQVQAIQGELNVLVRKDTTLDNLCNIENCAWSKDIVSQIESNARAIKSINDVIGNGSIQQGDLLFATTKQINITLTNQSLNGNNYLYDFEYDISDWDNSTYNLEAVIFKNIHKDSINALSGEVDIKLRSKTFVNITYDEQKLYGSIQTPNMLETTTGQYKLVVTCLWKKVLS